MADRFKMRAYTGPVLKNAFWGRFTIDISGIRTPQGKMPALREHNRLRAVGVLDKKSKSLKALVAEGYFLNSSDGRECKALLGEGFPMQASIGVNFEKVEKLDDGETVSVNGGSFTGPGVVVRQSYVREISFVSLGADDNTSISNLSLRGNESMEEKQLPKDFNGAMLFYLEQGHSLDDSIKLAVENFPEQYKAYCEEIYQPYLKQLA